MTRLECILTWLDDVIGLLFKDHVKEGFDPEHKLAVVKLIEIQDALNRLGASERINEAFSADSPESSGVIDIGIDDVIFHDPATIVYWNDGDKTVVKCSAGDNYSPELGLLIATLKHILGDDAYSAYRRMVRKAWIKESE